MTSKNNLYKAGKKFNKAMMSIVNNPNTGIDSITISSGSEEIVSFKNQSKPQMKTALKKLNAQTITLPEKI